MHTKKLSWRCFEPWINAVGVAPVAPPSRAVAPIPAVLSHALLIALGLMTFAVAGPARAQDVSGLRPGYGPYSAATSDSGNGSNIARASTHVEAYGGFDVASNGWLNAWAQGTFAPVNSDTSGPRYRIFGEAGQYQFHSETFGTINKEQVYGGSFLIGSAYLNEHFGAEFYIGFNILDHVLAHPDPDNPVQGSRVGAKVSGEFEWMDNHSIIAGEADYTTAFNSYNVNLKLGHELVQGIFVGPEFTALGDQRFNQWRLGANVTVTNFNNARIGISAGYKNDSDMGPGAYTSLLAGIQF